MELSDVAVFVKVIQLGSFTEAARRLGVPKSTVSSKVSALEKRLGVTLLQRTTRKLHLTEEGQIFFQTCARALAEIESAEATVTGAQKAPKGRVSITAPNDIAKLLARFIKSFRDSFPCIEIDLKLTNRYVDLIGEGVDVAIRAGDLQDSSLIARKIATTTRALFASQNYLSHAGMPKHPKELAEHQCILFSHAKSNRWQLSSGKSHVDIRVSGAVSADDIIALKELALQGLGIAMVPSFICREELAAKSLIPVLPSWVGDTSAISIVYPARKFQHPKHKVLIENLVKFLAEVFVAIS